MGNDGGSIPTRRELVKEAARNPTTTELKETQNNQQEYYWTTCPLSQRPLATPIVSDSSGKLYNKDAVLEYLLPADDGTPGRIKSDNEEVLEGRVKSIRDVVEVKFEVVGEVSSVRKGGNMQKEEKWVCPIARKELGPGVKAVYLVPCGHAFSEIALKEVLAESCLQCNKPFSSENIIPILPTAPVDIARLATRIKNLKESGLTHSLKKAPGSNKKRKKNHDGGTEPAIGVTPVAEIDITKNASKPVTPQPSSGTATPRAGIKNAATASLTAKVLEDEKERIKKRKLGMNDNLKSLFSSGGSVTRKDGDFMTRGYSIPAGAKR
ncbi:hypothetical protein FGG08_002776 [Glutinoglossum americanum]|uniref:Replication termination factor 2 n=1 Tax=Glutinoglossum americanum TaxID=1670608 RepID=A0A9P8IC83_9PEZI|nr:hypothetical protein FGG08_002776 [Glutinoglossum americanum]